MTLCVAQDMECDLPGQEQVSLWQYAARVSILVSKLAPPDPPRPEVALWAVASCDTLSRAPASPCVNGKSLRETCEAVKDFVERANKFASALAILQPLDFEERSAVQAISDARRKYFFALAMSLKLHPGNNFVRVGPSEVHGMGVFATEDIPKHTCFTAYPIDLLALRQKASGACYSVMFSRRHEHSDVKAHKRLQQQLLDYALDIAPCVTVYADPATHSPGFCGHMINDPRGTASSANCVECPIGGGALIGILSLRTVRKGEELLMNYGKGYWQARSERADNL